MANAWQSAPVIGGNQPTVSNGWRNAQVVRPAQKKAPPAPSLWDNLTQGAGNLAYGAAKGLADPVYGVSQMALHGANALTGGALNGATKQYDNFLSKVENQYQSDTKGSIAAGVGRVAGNLAYPVPAAAEAGGVSALIRGAAGARTGVVIGATQPVFNSNNYAKDKLTQVGTGAALGGGLSVAGAAAGGTYNALRPLISPKTTVGNQLYKNLNALALGPNPDMQIGAGTLDALTGSGPADVLNRLKTAQPLVPGSLPTTAQVAGVPQLVMGEKVLKNNPTYRAAFEDRAIANNKARLQALQSVAKTPEELNAAIDARKTATQPLYDAAMNAMHPVDDTLQSILSRPSAQKALARGKVIAQERGDPITPTAAVPGTPEQQVASSILDPNGNPFTSLMAAQPGTPAQIGGKDLSYLKMGLDDLLNTGRTTGIGSHEANAISQTHQDLHDWLVDNSPDYAKANQLYAQMSVPINTMQVGQDLYGSLANGTLNAAGDVAPALSIFRNKYAQALKSSPYGIDPDAQKTLDAIQQDLQRETISNSIKSAGSDTAFNMQAPNWLSGQLFGTGLDGSSKLTNSLSGVMGFLHGGPLGALGAAKGSQMLGNFVGNRVNGEFQKAMLEPDYFAQLVEDAAKRNGQPINYLNPSAASTAGAP